jgi:hypothetical protein
MFGARRVQSTPTHHEADQAGGECHDGDRDGCGGQTTGTGTEAGQPECECQHRGDVQQEADCAEGFDSWLVGSFHHGDVHTRVRPDTNRSITARRVGAFRESAHGQLRNGQGAPFHGSGTAGLAGSGGQTRPHCVPPKPSTVTVVQWS